MVGVDKMTVTGRKARPSFTSPRRLNTMNATTTEHKVIIQLMTNMEIVSASARIECETWMLIARDSTTTVVGPSLVTYVKLFQTCLAKDLVVKSTGPESPTANGVVGIDLFVALSTTKTNAVNVLRSNGDQYWLNAATVCSISKETKSRVLGRRVVSNQLEPDR